MSFLRLRLVTSTLIVACATVLAAPALAQPTGCPTVNGFTCDGYVTDVAGVLRNETPLETLVSDIIANHGNEIAVVIVPDSGSMSPADLVEEIGNTWGVGDPDKDDGIVVLVSLAERETRVATGPGADLPERDIIATLGNASFAAGDYDGGVAAILNGINALYQADVEGADRPIGDTSGVPWRTVAFWVLFAGGAATWMYSGSRSAKRKALRAAMTIRERQVDDELARLEPSGSELTLRGELFMPRPITAEPATTAEVMAILSPLLNKRAPETDRGLATAWSNRLIDVLDARRVADEREMPLELEITGEQDLL
ncbi:MAG: TPM domain-containing protein, partial [Acidimicrobiia bacterium]|nr:TPM domain-containing protein [Acidimicrobiia bacterium]